MSTDSPERREATASALNCWSEDLVAALKKRAKIKLGTQSTNDRRNQAIKKLIDNGYSDPQEIALTLYMFGDCGYFARAVNKKYGLPIKLIYVSCSIEPTHIVNKLQDDIYVDISGVKTLPDLNAKYGEELRLVDGSKFSEEHLNDGGLINLALKILDLQENRLNCFTPWVHRLT
jgi:hypothetical protein